MRSEQINIAMMQQRYTRSNFHELGRAYASNTDLHQFEAVRLQLVPITQCHDDGKYTTTGEGVVGYTRQSLYVCKHFFDESILASWNILGASHGRQLANGYLVRACLAHFYPSELDKADFDTGNSPSRKRANWDYLQKFAGKRGFSFRTQDIDCLCRVSFFVRNLFVGIVDLATLICYVGRAFPCDGMFPRVVLCIGR